MMIVKLHLGIGILILLIIHLKTILIWGYNYLKTLSNNYESNMPTF